MVKAPSLWFKALSKVLYQQGFTSSKADPCLFINQEKNIIIITYVDDCLLFCKDQVSLEKLISEIRKKHPLTDNDIGTNVYDYLGIEVTMRNKKVELRQSGLIEKILLTTRYTNINGNVKNPAKESPLALDKDVEAFNEDYEYSSVVGMLLYLANKRPDIQYAVHSCCCFVHCPKRSHAHAIKRT